MNPPIVVVLPILAPSHTSYPMIEALKQHANEIVLHRGEWVLVQGSRIINYVVSLEEGMEEGYSKFGTKPFIVMEIDTLIAPAPKAHQPSKFFDFFRNLFRGPRGAAVMWIEVI
jgi:hypothetical protein